MTAADVRSARQIAKRRTSSIRFYRTLVQRHANYGDEADGYRKVDGRDRLGFNRDPICRVVALVGEKGSGTTTVASGLTEFYPPAGGVHWDEVDIDRLLRRRLCAYTAMLVQDSVRYRLTAFGKNALYISEHREAVYTSAQHTGSRDVKTALPSGFDALLRPQSAIRGVRG